MTDRVFKFSIEQESITADQESSVRKPMTISQMISGWAERSPSEFAIVAPGMSPLTYGRLNDQVDSLVASLRAMGIGRDDRVAVVLSNGPAMAIAFLATAIAGISAPLNPAYRESEFDFYLSDLNAKALIVQEGIDSPAMTVACRRGIPILALSADRGLPDEFTTVRSFGTSSRGKGPMPRPDDVALVLYTSGTTSKPKRVPLSHANLLVSAHNIEASLALKSRDRCLNLMPLFHIHGLVGGLLSSLAAGASVAVPEQFDPDHVFQWMEELQPTWYTAVPTIHQAILREARSRSCTYREWPLRFVRSSSAPLPVKLMAELEEFFKVPVIEAYGMTEAAHQIASNPLPPRKRKAGSVGLAAGPDVSIMDEAGNLLSTGEIGEIVIRGANVMHGYDNNSDANATVFTQGWFRTGDQGYLDEAGYLFITGRLKEIINRGGEKISSIEIDQVLLAHPAVAEANAFAVSHASLGEDIAAAVVLRTQVAATELELQQFVASRLADFKVPRQIIIVDAIPKTATGKIQRIGLAEKLGVVETHQNPDTRRTVAVTPRTQIENVLTRIWSAVLGLDVGLDDNFLHLGGNSIHAAQIISRIRESLGAELSFAAFFEAPTVGSMARVVATASQKLRSIKALPFPEEGIGPLSFTQEALWFLDQLDPGNAAYNRSVFARLEGELKPSLLEKCISEIVRRHSSLRTHFPAEDGEATQRVYAAQHFSLPVMDISRLPFREREAQLRKLTAEEARKPFDLAKGPTFRAKLVRVEERLHVLLATAHHIVIDGWSAEIFLQELQILYDAFSTGLASPLADLPIQYLAFARWQRDSVDDSFMKAHVKYWKQQLGDYIPPLNLITSHPRPRSQTFNGAKRHFRFSKDLLEGLKAGSRQEEATLFVTLLSAFNILLHHYSGQENLIVGTPFAGRNQLHTEGMIGNFTTTLPLRTNLSGNPSFGELLARVRKTVQEAHAHQDVPFETIAPQLRMKRDSSRPPVYQVLFQLRNYPRDFRQSGELRIEKLERESENSAFDMSLSISEDRNGLAYDIVYNTDLFDDATIERMAAQFDNLVKNIVANPDQKISEFQWLTETKQRGSELSELTDAEADSPLPEGTSIKADHATELCGQELREVQMEKSSANTFPRGGPNLSPEQEAIRAKCFHPTGTFVEFPKEEIEQSIPERFEKIVRLYSDRLAVKDRHHGLIYEELNNSANRLAQAIIAQRSSDAEPIALLLEHGVPMITAVFGVLKTGKFYVPLEPSHPQARTRYMLEDIQPGLIVTDNCNLSLAQELAQNDFQLLNIDELNSSLFSGNTAVSTRPEAYAYVLYTSGSTGQPKGVIQTHRNVLHDCMSYTSNVHICTADRIGLLAPFSVGASVHYLFGALLNGASLFPLDIGRDGLACLAKWLIQEKINVFQLSANVFPYFIDTLSGTEEFLDVRLLALGSSQVSKQIIESYKNSFPSNCILLNRLSTTESNTICWNFIDKSFQVTGDTLPVGYPVEDKEVLLIDEAGAEVAFGNVGEIAVKSHYLSPGYWHRPELTRLAFHSVPNAEEQHIYRTGDLGRLHPNRCLEHLGRKDFRVKIRGFTVEVAEIERALLEHLAIREASVTYKNDSFGEKHLVAYVVPHHDTTITVSELRSSLKATLPEYMVPSAFMILNALPLTTSGKVDRNALPDPAPLRFETEPANPTNSIEKEIARIWVEVLKLDQIGIHDNFFELGGHSLLATVIMSRIRDKFQIEIPFRQFLEAPTVAGLAQSINKKNGSFDKLDTVPMHRVSRDAAIPLSFAQLRIWFLAQLEPKNPVYNQPKVLRLRGNLDFEALHKTVNAVVARHEILRTTFLSSDGQPVQVINEISSVDVPVIDLGNVPENKKGAEFQRLAVEIARRPFDLAQDLMIRAALFRLEGKDHSLLLVTHHIATDGWSDRLLFNEISVFYRAFSSGVRPELPDLSIQYADFTVWQRQWLQGETLDAQLAYWLEHLKDAPRVLELPIDRSRPAVQSFRGARRFTKLSKTLSEKLKKLSQQEGVTLFMTLLAAFHTLLYRYTHQDRIVVGSPVANRTRTEVEPLMGFFVNTLVLDGDFSSNSTFRELLASTRETCLRAYANQDLPFEKLVEELHPTRELNRNPLFQVMFQLRNTPGQVLKLPQLTIQEIEFDSGIAKFDLALSMVSERDFISGVLEYTTDLFDGSTIDRMLDHFQTLLEGIVTDPDQCISDLPILTEKERHELLVEWNDTQRDYPNACIQELFERQVGKTPDAVAVIFEDQQLTYRELNSRANQLAHCLRRRGVGPETLIAICAERSLEMVIGLVGILKAGAAYLPLDPTYPAERIAFMLEDSVVPVLLTQTSISTGPLSFVINGSSTRETICLDSDWKMIAQESTENPKTNIAPENLAYVIYTSGSTGKPKGVMVTHANVVRLFSVTEPWFAFSDRDVWTLFHSYAFDFSVWEMWGALLSGGRLVVVPYWVSRSPEAFWKLSKKENVTVLNQTPSAFRQLMPFAIGNGRAEPLSLRWIIFGGEALDLQSLRPWMDCYGDHNPQLVNMYGITETTVHVTYRPLTLADTRSSSGSLIGRPIADLQLYILDENRQLVPIGVPGEVYIAGAGVARGYLNRPELTDERFILHSFHEQQQAVRLYKSGDRARRLSNGDFEYLGRVDGQVKIRGFRVEVGEIEVVLNQHSAVREVAVVARENRAAENQLVAYVVLRQQGTTTVNDLRSFMKAKLPDYMIPAAFVLLDILPITPNGKVDRRALPELDPRRPELEQAFVAPQNDFENSIATVWRDALHLEKVGIHDNFFDLGGHSLLLVQVHSRVQRLVDRDLSLIEMFEHPTVHSLATHLGQETRHSLQENQNHIQNKIDSKSRITRQRLQRQRLSHGE